MNAVALQVPCAALAAPRLRARSRLQRTSARSAVQVRALFNKGEAQSAPQKQKTWPEDIAPPGMPVPPMKPAQKAPMFGFVENAEVMNSRAAMIGFFALLLVEAITGKGFLEVLGIEIGNGIDIGF